MVAREFCVFESPRSIAAKMKLFLCEKPSQGRDIARVLGATRSEEGCLSGPDLTVTWLFGHSLEMSPPDAYGEQYKKWTLEQLPIIPTQWRLHVKPNATKQCNLVRNLLRRATEVIIATDADREGEMIGREILEWFGYCGPVQRLWLSALNDASIRKALGSLKPGSITLPLYHAALARARADWLVGMNLSRLFTLLARQAGHNGVLSIGRVQTPTLQLVAQRDHEIASFKPVPYWTISVSLERPGSAFVAEWQPPADSIDGQGRCVREATAQQALMDLPRGSTARVVSVETDRVREPPPLPFDLSTLQATCSHALGLDVQHTLSVAQSLYETHKAITYPRSDCRHLPQNMHSEAPALVAALLRTDSRLRSACQSLDFTRRSRAWNDTQVTAHHALIPTVQVPDEQALSADEWAVYQLIRASYLAQFMPDHEYDRTHAQLHRGLTILQARGRKTLRNGWRGVMAGDRASDQTQDGAEEEQPLPQLSVGSEWVVSETRLRALKTAPPRHFTQGELVQAMKGIARWVSDPQLKKKLKETTGIGTEATRAGIISGLLARGYLVKHGRTVRASDIAFALLLRIPPAVADPVTTALWEQALDRIASGELALDEFVRQQSRWVSDIVQAHRARTWESAASIAEPLARQRLLRQSFGSEPKGRPPRASRSRRH
jgi:DNA topoisomerase-3